MITRCICFKRSFAELKAIAAAHQAREVEALQAHVSFGRNCMLCVPYVARMLETGETEFAVDADVSSWQKPQGG
jgi:bacterioferritin-associated ferredoxin